MCKWFMMSFCFVKTHLLYSYICHKYCLAAHTARTSVFQLPILISLLFIKCLFFGGIGYELENVFFY